MNKITISKYFFYFILFIIVENFSFYLSNYLYYDIFHKVDPYHGPTYFRIFLTSICRGVIISISLLIYTKIVFKKYMYTLYLITYTLVLSLSILGYININHSFPEIRLGWFWIENITFIGVVFIIIGGVYFINLFKNSKTLGTDDKTQAK